MRTVVRTWGSMLFAVLLAAGCSDSSGPDDDDDGNESSMTATINGAAFTPTVILAARSGSNVSIFGRDAQNQEIDIAITGVTAAGTFNIGSGQAASVELTTANGQVWVGHLAGATGSVVLTMFASDHMMGTFNVTLQPQTATGASGTRVLVGSFVGYFGQT